MTKQKGRVRADAKGRVSLAKFLRTNESVDLDISVLEDGRILLTPLAFIPASQISSYNKTSAEANKD